MNRKYLIMIILSFSILISMLPMVKASDEQILDEYTEITYNQDYIMTSHPSTDMSTSAFANNFTTTARWSVTKLSFYLSRYLGNESNYDDEYIAARLYASDPLDPTLPDETNILGNSSGVRVDSLPEDVGGTVGEWINFTFSTPVTLESGIEYFYAVYGLNGTWETVTETKLVFVYGSVTDPAYGHCLYQNGWIFDVFWNMNFIIYGEVIMEVQVPYGSEQLSEVIALFSVFIVVLLFLAMIPSNDKTVNLIKKIMVTILLVILVVIIITLL